LPTDNRVSASLEDYIEAIFHIMAEKRASRAKDIAERLQVKAASVTGALRLLSEKGLINYAPYDLITLTPKGERVAEEVIRRHETLKDFLVKVLLIAEDEAEKSACNMEHTLSDKILTRLIKFLAYVETFCPFGGEKWIEDFGHFCETGKIEKDCKYCVAPRPQ
jgi:DtxR family Mn-dependent transcriptional regulator